MEQEYKYNWCALAVMIVNRCTVEQAFVQMEQGSEKRRYKKHWSKQERDDVVFIRDSGMSNRQVGDMFGVGASRISVIYNEEKRKQAARNVNELKQT